MAPPLSWGAARHRKNAGRSGSCATTRPLQGFRHLSGDLWSRGCKFSILRWLEPAERRVTPRCLRLFEQAAEPDQENGADDRHHDGADQSAGVDAKRAE